MNAQFRKSIEGRKFPGLPDYLQAANYYLFDTDGTLLTSRHNSIHHVTLLGLNACDLFPIHGRLRPAWEAALRGEPAGFMNSDPPENRNFFLNLHPIRKKEGGEVEFILAQMVAADQGFPRWLAELGWPVTK